MTAPYVRIVDAIRRRVLSGELRAGERVPSARQIVREWGVAIATATKVLATLRQEGLVRAVPGVGTVVAAYPPSPVRSIRKRATREPPPELTRERIVQAAIEIADAEGLAVLSMRRVASELDVATMSLYRYVASKDELIAWMADHALQAEFLPEPPPAGWRAQLEAIARLQWTLCRRHPWLAQAISITRPQGTPNALAGAEWVMRALDGYGLHPSIMLHVHITLFSYVRGLAVNLEWEAEAEQQSGITSEQWLNAHEQALKDTLSSGAYPIFARVLSNMEHELNLDTLFEFGLQRLLDGLEGLFRLTR